MTTESALLDQAHNTPKLEIAHLPEKLLLAFYIIMGTDVVDENIHKICYYCFKPLKKMSYFSIKDKAYEGNLENAS